VRTRPKGGHKKVRHGGGHEGGEERRIAKWFQLEPDYICQKQILKSAC